MKKISNREDLKKYILRQLGHPILKVELTDEHLDDCINKAIERYSYYAFGGTSEIAILVELEPNVLEYKLPDSIIAVTAISECSNDNFFIGFPQPMAVDLNMYNINTINNQNIFDIGFTTSQLAGYSTIRSLFKLKPNYTFNHNNKILRFLEKPRNNKILLEVGIEYTPNEEEDYIFNNQWIKKRSQGEAMLLWSLIVGKYGDSQLINGSSINYSKIEADGLKLIDESEEELLEIGEALGVYVF